MSALVTPGQSTATTLALCLIVLAGGALRLWGIDAGAPFRMGVDEPIVLSTAMRIVKTGDFNPHFFDYGGLTFYLHAAAASVAFLSGAMDGRWTALSGIWEGDILVASRIMTALFGTLTILVVFRIGLRWGVSVGLLAALAMAVLPQHVRESHMALTDTPLTLFTALVLLMALRAVETPGYRTLALAGLTVGLTAAVKYNGGLALVIPLAAVAALPRGRRAGGVATVAAASAGGFLAGAPYSLLDLPNFLDGFAALMQSYNQNRPFAEASSIYLRHLRNWFSWPGVLPPQLGNLALLLAIAGAAALVLRREAGRPRISAAVLLVFPVFYFLFISSQASLQYGRYLLPLAPMLCVSLGAGITLLSSAMTRRFPKLGRGALPLLTAILMAPPTASAVSWDLSQLPTSTSEQAASWLVQHAKPGEIVVIESTPLQLPPRFTSVHVHDLIGKTVEQYQAEGVDYLLASSSRSEHYYADPAGRNDQVIAYRTMLAMSDVVATFPRTPAHPGPTMSVLRLRGVPPRP